MITNEALIEILTLRCEVDKDGTKCYYNKAGRLHRVHGPAFEWANGGKEWWLNGLRHRVDGLAVDHPDGSVVQLVRIHALVS